jgi:hypothetical protein
VVGGSSHGFGLEVNPMDLLSFERTAFRVGSTSMNQSGAPTSSPMLSPAKS